MDLLPNEKVYPIYSVIINWVDDSCKQYNTKTNGTSYTVMYKEEVSIEKVINDTKQGFIHRVFDKRDKRGRFCKRLLTKNPRDVRFEIEFLEHESWYLRWFCHGTYNTHLSDFDLIRSFERFVWRKEDLNLKNGHTKDMPHREHTRFKDGKEIKEKNDKPFHCLMGAEDRYRWSEPCHCNGCKKNNQTIITH